MVDFGCKYKRPSSCVGCECIEKFLKFSRRLIFDNSCKVTFGTAVFQTPVLLIVIHIKQGLHHILNVSNILKFYSVPFCIIPNL